MRRARPPRQAERACLVPFPLARNRGVVGWKKEEKSERCPLFSLIFLLSHMDAKWRLEFADASTSGSNPPSNPPGYSSLKQLGVRHPLARTLATPLNTQLPFQSKPFLFTPFDSPVRSVGRVCHASGRLEPTVLFTSLFLRDATAFFFSPATRRKTKAARRVAAARAGGAKRRRRWIITRWRSPRRCVCRRRTLSL